MMFGFLAGTFGAFLGCSATTGFEIPMMAAISRSLIDCQLVDNLIKVVWVFRLIADPEFEIKNKEKGQEPTRGHFKISLRR